MGGGQSTRGQQVSGSAGTVAVVRSHAVPVYAVGGALYTGLVGSVIMCVDHWVQGSHCVHGSGDSRVTLHIGSGVTPYIGVSG